MSGTLERPRFGRFQLLASLIDEMAEQVSMGELRVEIDQTLHAPRCYQALGLQNR